MSAGAGVALLPEALLAEILQHVPQQQRLTCCALACKAWAAAAVLATIDVKHRVTVGNMRALSSWLGTHAGQLEHLELDSGNMNYEVEVQLPLHNLKNLEYLQLDNLRLLPPGGEAGSDMPLGGAGSRAGSSGDGHAGGADTATPLLPNLPNLELIEVELPSLSTLLQLAQAAPQLTSLCTNALAFQQPDFCSTAVHNEPEDTQQVADALPGLLQQLPRLEVLELQGMPLSTAAVQQIATMQGLQQAFLAHARDMPVRCFCCCYPWASSALLHPADNWHMLADRFYRVWMVQHEALMAQLHLHRQPSCVVDRHIGYSFCNLLSSQGGRWHGMAAVGWRPVLSLN